MLGLAGEVRKFTDAVVEALGKSLEKGPAAGGTGFIQLHAVQYAVIDKDGFHVLTANIEDEGNLVVDFLGCQIVGNGFDDARVEAEGCLDKVFAIACRAASHDAGIGPNGQAFRIKIGKSLTHRSYGVAVIGAVVGIRMRSFSSVTTSFVVVEPESMPTKTLSVSLVRGDRIIWSASFSFSSRHILFHHGRWVAPYR